MKRCSKCKETKPYEMFSKCNRYEDGHQCQCKACTKAYREANKEKIAERDKAYYEANKEKRLEYMKAYRKANKEKRPEYDKAYYEANREKKLEYHKDYREANKEKVAELSSRRRARKRNAIPRFLRKCEVEKQRLRDIYKLRQVMSIATGVEHHVDHMWPLSDGGPHWSGNLQIIPAYDNLSKSTSVCKETKKFIRESLKIARKEYNDNSRNGY